MARKRRRSPRRKRGNLMLHRTRNLGVVGTRGGGLIAWTKGAFNKLKNAVQRIKILISQDGDILVTEDDITLSPER
jgi:hypothetical protein